MGEKKSPPNDYSNNSKDANTTTTAITPAAVYNALLILFLFLAYDLQSV